MYIGNGRLNNELWFMDVVRQFVYFYKRDLKKEENII